ncbi:MAG: AI-2E family transporter [Candidatus Eremiobacteraeota bacterium]|nr:AI-2E family transporter [Candidatus Eremiobacteraeota bacterium]
MNPRLATALSVLAIVVLSAVVLIGFVWFLGRVHTVTTIVVAAIFLCYALYPSIRRLSMRLPAWAAILVVYVVLIAVIAIGLSIVVPAIVGNAKQLVADAPALTRAAQDAISNPNNPLLSRVPAPARAQIAALPSEIATVSGQYASELTGSVLRVLLSAFSIMALFIIVPIVTLYILMDRERLREEFIGRVPPASRAKVLKIQHEINVVLGGYIRGQLLVAAIVGVLIALMLSLLHVRYAVLIGAVAGVLEIIPYAGAVAGAIPGVLIALLTNGPINAVLVIVGFVAINQIEGHVLAPLVVGESVGVRPLTVILALFIGAELAGIGGMLVAVPIAGIIKVLVENLVPKYEPVVVPAVPAVLETPSNSAGRGP